MAKIPLEDTFADVINKTQRGRNISDEQLCKLAEVSAADLNAVKNGKPIDAVIRRVARHLKLNPELLEELAHKAWYPDQPNFPHGFAMFNTPHEDMRVNSYLIWDTRAKEAAAFDTGSNVEDMLATAHSERVKISHIFITHSHEDHIEALKPLAEATGASVWASDLEPVHFPGAKTFKENAHFHIGALAVKTLTTSGHSPGQTTFFVTGLSWPIAVVGDSLFAASMGGSPSGPAGFEEQFKNNTHKIFSLPKDTVFAPGHGPLTTLSQERKHNPFFGR